MASALLCLESSGNLCSVAVTGFDHEAYLQSEPGQKHTEVILGMIRGCLTAAGGSREGLQGIAFDRPRRLYRTARCLRLGSGFGLGAQYPAHSRQHPARARLHPP